MRNVIFTELTIEDLTSIIQKTVSNEINRNTEPNQQNETNFLSRNEVCKLLKISLPTLHKWTKTGKIKGHHIGRSVRYKKEEVLSSMTQIRTNLIN